MSPSPDLPSLEAARLAGRALAVDLDLPSKMQPYDPAAWRSGDSAHPTLQLDDVSGIPFLIDVSGVEEYQHRGRLRAGDHDVYVTVTPEMEGVRTVLSGDPSTGRARAPRG